MTKAIKTNEEFLKFVSTTTRRPAGPSNQLTNAEHINPLTKRETVEDPPNHADVVILAAMRDPEMNQMSGVLTANNCSFRDEARDGVVFTTTTYQFDGKSLALALAVPRDQGMVQTAILAAKSITAFNPHLLMMVGICAGIEGKVQLGDVIIGTPVFDYGRGKTQGGRFQPDFTEHRLCRKAADIARGLSEDNIFRTELNGLCNSKGGPSHHISIRVGPLGTGAGVIADNTFIETIKEHRRNLFGIDMEAFAVAQSAYEAGWREIPWVVIKGVQDFADPNKNDTYRDFAARASAICALKFLSLWMSSKE